MSSMTRTYLDLADLTPATLDTLGEREFRSVVDADLKRTSANRNHQEVPQWISLALREAHVERWLTALHAMLASVQGQLELWDHDFERRKADCDNERELRQITAEHHQAQTGRVRFRTALLEAIPEATRLHEGRVLILENAIRTHRTAILADNTIEAGSHDRLLWSTLND
jgi:hypothetical protein